jgi:hypothetical protein
VKSRLPKPTVVFDTYWRFAAARQDAFFRRLSTAEPYTNDPILRQYRFTNAYRAADRVSQYLIRNVIYADRPSNVQDWLFRTILFRMFNKPATWQMLERALGWISWSEYAFDSYDSVLCAAMDRGDTIYSAAYIMPSRSGSLNSRRKHQNHLRVLEAMMAVDLPQRIADAPSASRAFQLLKSFPLIGDFLGYQFLIDLNYGSFLSFSEMEFVVPGPGAVSGLKKCFEDAAGLDDADLIRHTTDIQEREFDRRGLRFQSLWGRRLHLIDCQNLFCEVDKYARIAHPEFTAPGGRSRIKQHYRPNSEPLPLWFPPKWGLNKRMLAHQSQTLRQTRHELR